MTERPYRRPSGAAYAVAMFVLAVVLTAVVAKVFVFVLILTACFVISAAVGSGIKRADDNAPAPPKNTKEF